MAIGVINRRKSYYDITAEKMINLTEEEYERLQIPLEDEPDEQKKLGSDYIKTTLVTSY